MEGLKKLSKMFNIDDEDLHKKYTSLKRESDCEKYVEDVVITDDEESSNIIRKIVKLYLEKDIDINEKFNLKISPHDKLHTKMKGDENVNQTTSFLKEKGYAILDRGSQCNAGDNSFWSKEILDKIEMLNDKIREESSFHPVFIFLNPEVWDVIYSLFDVIEPLLGAEAVLEPSFFAFLLKEGSNSDKKTMKNYSGSNFALPHRDYSYEESHFIKKVEGKDGTKVELRNDSKQEGNDGSKEVREKVYKQEEKLDSSKVEEKDSCNEDRQDGYKLLSVWVPLSEASIDNGCMYVIPKDCDEGFASKTLTVASRNGKSTNINFPLEHCRPLPCSAGSVCFWNGNLIHWGSSCYKNVKPRASIAFTFRRKDGDKFDGRDPITKSDLEKGLTYKQVCRLILSSLILYEQWINISETMPNEIFSNL